MDDPAANRPKGQCITVIATKGKRYCHYGCPKCGSMSVTIGQVSVNNNEVQHDPVKCNACGHQYQLTVEDA